MQRKTKKKITQKRATRSKTKVDRDQILDFQSEGNNPRKIRSFTYGNEGFLERNAKKLFVRLDRAFKSIKRKALRPKNRIA